MRSLILGKSSLTLQGYIIIGQDVSLNTVKRLSKLNITKIKIKLKNKHQNFTDRNKSYVLICQLKITPCSPGYIWVTEI